MPTAAKRPTPSQSRSRLTSPVRAAIYVRISLDREGAGLGVARQEEDCRAWVERREGWEVAEVYVDNDVSASSTKPRPQWQRLLADIDEGHVDAIVVWHIDRMTRKPRELEDVIDLAEQRGVQLGTVTGDVDLATPTGRMIARMLGAAARHEAEHKGQRQKRQIQQAAEAGRPHKHGNRPFGYLDDFVTAHPAEGPLVAEAAQRILAGETLISLARDWNTRGLTTPRGNAWGAQTIRQILKSARISGRREIGGGGSGLGEITAVDCWDALVTVEQSDRLRRLLTDSSRQSNGGATTRKYLLSGLLTCGECGRRMTAATSSTKQQYRCNPKGGTIGFTGCGGVAITRRHADDFVVGSVLHALDSPALHERLQQRNEPDPAVSAQIVADEQELLDIADDRIEGRITRAEWSRMRQRLDARLQKNRRKLARLTNTRALTLIEGDGTLRERWDRLNMTQQRAIITTVLDTVTVAKSQNTGRRFSVDRLRPIWKV